jgi:hypothetical protein
MKAAKPHRSGVLEPVCIELRLRELSQLFNSFDPAPFDEKHLDRDAEEFLVSWALELSPAAPLLFRLHLPRDQQRLDPERIVQHAVRHYFAYRSSMARLDVRRTLQHGRTSLLVGVTFLVLCTAVRELWHTFGFGEWGRIVEEGVLILGWVAMWRPLDLLLYDWWPHLRRKHTYDKLSRMQVEVVYPDAAPPAVPML